jgi:hypothetical protein
MPSASDYPNNIPGLATYRPGRTATIEQAAADHSRHKRAFNGSVAGDLAAIFHIVRGIAGEADAVDEADGCTSSRILGL